MPIFHVDEREEILDEARRCRDLTPEQRMAAFKDILAMVSAIWASLPEKEQIRRLRIGEALDARPEPWWKDVRKEGLPSTHSAGSPEGNGFGAPGETAPSNNLFPDHP